MLGVTIDDSLQLLKGYPEYLVARGWEVHVVSCPGPRLDLIASTGNVQTHPMKMRRKPGPFGDLVALVRWFVLLRRIKPDVVYVGTPKAGLLGTLAAFANRVPIRVYLLRGLRLETSAGIGLRVLTFMEKLTIQASTAVRSISPSLTERAIELNLVANQKIRTVGYGSSNGVDIAQFDPGRFSDAEIKELGASIGLRQDLPTVGFVGRLTRDKGLFDLADAVEILHKSGRDCQLLIIGGIDDASGKAAIERLNRLTTPVVIPGHTLDPAPYYALMTIFCLPSLREGFGNVVIEASSMAIPVVVSNATGIVDAVEAGVTGITTPVSDPHALAANLETLLSNSELADSLGSNGREWVSGRFTRRVVQKFYADDLEETWEQSRRNELARKR